MEKNTKDTLQDVQQESKQEAPTATEAEQKSVEDSLIETSAKLESEVKSLKDLILREKAENENLRKRFSKELEDAHKYGTTSFARDMLEVLENLNRACEDAEQNSSNSNNTFTTFFDGVKLTKDTLEKVFTKYGITRINPIGEKFDHDFHQAIMQIPAADKEEGIVVQVIQTGYVIKDRLLRPAMVAVSKKPDA